MVKKFVVALFALPLLLAATASGQAADYSGAPTQQDPTSDQRVYLSLNGDPRIPRCDASSVQKAIKKQIAAAIPLYYNDRRIDEIRHIHQSGYWLANPSPLARRYCNAEAVLTDGSHQRLYYQVTEHAGFLGISWNVNACLLGLDRWRVYDGNCRRVRPQY
ncbi:cytoplasmic protein [Pseudovibrio sp. SPO723]|uniref:cytoplasmic protein n=1 Tax=Nesiotobacter zosterae TaxID=392721 RepID=UPI0029C20E94|nr:cytoplasmic protein [Pseudovibrio sp. SPO723]MDX5593936.1 cytoplasmic protein [Pseudovibrio sp. SPO723]